MRVVNYVRGARSADTCLVRKPRGYTVSVSSVCMQVPWWPAATGRNSKRLLLFHQDLLEENEVLYRYHDKQAKYEDLANNKI